MRIAKIHLKSSGKQSRKARKEGRKNRRKNRKYKKVGLSSRRKQKTKTQPWCVKIENGKKNRIRNKHCSCPKAKVKYLTKAS